MKHIVAIILIVGLLSVDMLSQYVTLPAEGRIRSGYGPRKHPLSGETLYHYGVDIAANRGSAVRSISFGVVESAVWDPIYGNIVTVDHGFGLVSRYAHLRRMSVKKGDSLNGGDVVGTVGNTGRTTGYHLHFEIWVDGHPTNPSEYME